MPFLAWLGETFAVTSGRRAQMPAGFTHFLKLCCSGQSWDGEVPVVNDEVHVLREVRSRISSPRVTYFQSLGLRESVAQGLGARSPPLCWNTVLV